MNPHRKLGYDRQMLLQILPDNVTELVIVVQRLDLLDLPEGIKGTVIQVIDVVDVRIRDHDVRQLLHVPDAVCYTRGKLRAHVVGGGYEAGFGEGAAEDHELTETYWAGFFGNPSEHVSYLAGRL